MPKPRNAPDDPVTNTVNALLDALRDEYGITSDAALAAELSKSLPEPLSSMAIYRWRRGKYGDKAVRVLIPAAIRHCDTVRDAVR